RYFQPRCCWLRFWQRAAPIPRPARLPRICGWHITLSTADFTKGGERSDMRFVSPIQPGGPGRGRGLRLMAAACTAGVMAFAAADASAAIVKNTNQTGAADAEVREEETSGTGQRGNNAELATRRGGTQNSVMLLRFNISDLTPQDLVDNPNVVIRLHANT